MSAPMALAEPFLASPKTTRSVAGLKCEVR